MVDQGFGKKLVPNTVLKSARIVRKQYFRTVRKIRMMNHQKISREEIAISLRRLGLDRGRDILVHSSFRTVGPVESGPVSIIHGIRDVIGSKGNILMPAYPLKTTMLEAMKNTRPFDMINEPSQMGILSEVFRNLPDVKRSGHPTHSVCVQGPDAEWYTGQHYLSLSPCGEGSPFRRLSQREGMILCIGCGIGKVTSHHNIEDIVARYPLNVYLAKIFTKEILFPDGSHYVANVLVHDPSLSVLRIDNQKSIERKFLQEMKKRRIVQEGRIGLAQSFLFGSAELDHMQRDLLTQGITIYKIEQGLV
jgi:aminoglycoside 3-N-acetyltransferase